jgi:hypothetical protein
MDFTTMGGDCTNFISQCLAAGGIPMTRPSGTSPIGDTGWYYIDANHRAAAFSGVQPLYDFLIKSGIGREAPIETLETGDIIQLSFDGEKFGHSLLVTEPGTNPKVATHSMDSFNRPLSSYGYVLARGIHII